MLECMGLHLSWLYSWHMLCSRLRSNRFNIEVVHAGPHTTRVVMDQSTQQDSHDQPNLPVRTDDLKCFIIVVNTGSYKR
jgi:hypothetical protein